MRIVLCLIILLCSGNCLAADELGEVVDSIITGFQSDLENLEKRSDSLDDRLAELREAIENIGSMSSSVIDHFDKRLRKFEETLGYLEGRVNAPCDVEDFGCLELPRTAKQEGKAQQVLLSRTTSELAVRLAPGIPSVVVFPDQVVGGWVTRCGCVELLKKGQELVITWSGSPMPESGLSLVAGTKDGRYFGLKAIAAQHGENPHLRVEIVSD